MDISVFAELRNILRYKRFIESIEIKKKSVKTVHWVFL